MADDSEDQIFVDVVPRLDEAAADDAAEKLSDRFKNVGKNIGEHIKDATKSIGEYLDDDVKESVKDFGRNLRDEVRSGDIGGAFDDIGRVLKNTTGAVTNIGDVFGINLDSVRDFGKSGTDYLGQVESAIGALTKTVGGFSDALRGINAGDISSRIGGAHDLLGQMHEAFGIGGEGELFGSLNDVLDRAQVWTDAIKGLKGFKNHDAAGGLASLQALLGAVDQDLLDNQPGSGNSVLGSLSAILGGAGAGAAAGAGIGSIFPGPGNLIGGGIGAVLGGGAAGLAVLNSPDQTAPKLPPALQEQVDLARNTLKARGEVQSRDQLSQMLLGQGPVTTTAPTILGQEPATVAPHFFGGASAAPVTTPAPAASSAGNVSITANTATVSAGSLSVAGLSLPSASSSSGGWGGGGGGSLGRSHWASGGVLPGDSPGYDNMLGMLPGTPIGLEGGEGILNPNAMQLPGVSDLVSGLQGFSGGSGGSILDDLTGGQKTAGPDVKGQQPGGVKGQSPGGVSASMPTGADLHASQPNQAPDQPSPPQTIIPQGKGEGFGIQGGILGGAESAAASMAPFGSGAAVQIGMDEANRAIEYGVKAGITLGVEAPLDTFWLSDSGLSDPSHSWFGKLGLNMIGQTAKSLNMQNLAGQTQAPLTPGQGQGQSPLGGQGQQQGPLIHIENQNNGSNVDHEGNNRSLVNQMNAYANY